MKRKRKLDRILRAREEQKQIDNEQRLVDLKFEITTDINMELYQMSQDSKSNLRNIVQQFANSIY